MSVSKLSCIFLSSKDNNAQLRSPSTHVGKCILLAVAIIILIGSIIATCCVYDQIGNWSLAIGGGGLIVALALTAARLCYNCKISSQYEIKEKLHSNVSYTSSAHSDEKKELNLQSMKQLLVPMRATDIELSGTLPKNIPSLCDISGKKWLDGPHLERYIAYLATKFSCIAVLDMFSAFPIFEPELSINKMWNYIFQYLPSQANNYSRLNLPIYLRISGNHFVLVYIDQERRTVEYYDSKKKFGEHKTIVQKLTVITNKLSQQEADRPPYRFICKIKKSLQLDSYQCGCWLLFFLEYRLTDPDFDFNRLEVTEAKYLIEKYRIKVMLKLIEMDRANSEWKKQGRENYLQYYKEETLAERMFTQDDSKLSFSERWKQILNGIPLVPDKTISILT